MSIDVRQSFNAKRVKGIPDYLLQEDRIIVECNMLGVILNDLSLLEEYSQLESSDFLTDSGILFFRMCQEISKAKITEFDFPAYHSFLSKREHLKDIYESVGGYETIVRIMKKIPNTDNSLAYYDELVKYNMITTYELQGFNLEKKWEDFKVQTTEEISQYIDTINSIAFKKKQTGSARPVDLTDKDGWEKYISDANAGLNFGIPLDDAYLTKKLAGIHKGDILAWTAHSGVGKTTSALSLIILPLLKRGQQVVILANEQSVNEFRNMLLPTIISTQLKDTKWVNRQTIMEGNFTSEQLDSFGQAVEWLGQYEGQLIFHPLESFKGTSVSQVIKRYVKDCPSEDDSHNKDIVFFFDTFKPSTEFGSGNAQSWQFFSEDAKIIHNTIKAKSVGGLEVAMILTMQLSGATSNVRYLDIGCLAKAKAVKEVLSQLIMMRKMRDDEYTDKKCDCKPFKWEKNDITGEYKRKYIKLDKNTTYHVVFIDKNRFGEADIQLLYKSQQGINKWTFVGECHIQQDY